MVRSMEQLQGLEREKALEFYQVSIAVLEKLHEKETAKKKLHNKIGFYKFLLYIYTYATLTVASVFVALFAFFCSINGLNYICSVCFSYFDIDYFYVDTYYLFNTDWEVLLPIAIISIIVSVILFRSLNNSQLLRRSIDTASEKTKDQITISETDTSNIETEIRNLQESDAYSELEAGFNDKDKNIRTISELKGFIKSGEAITHREAIIAYRKEQHRREALSEQKKRTKVLEDGIKTLSGDIQNVANRLDNISSSSKGTFVFHLPSEDSISDQFNKITDGLLKLTEAVKNTKEVFGQNSKDDD